MCNCTINQILYGSQQETKKGERLMNFVLRDYQQAASDRAVAFIIHF